MNFFIADVQLSFGTLVAFQLAQLGWSPDNIDTALVAGMISPVLKGVNSLARSHSLIDAS
jgi:hypothetical protein